MKGSTRGVLTSMLHFLLQDMCFSLPQESHKLLWKHFMISKSTNRLILYIYIYILSCNSLCDGSKANYPTLKQVLSCYTLLTVWL